MVLQSLLLDLLPGGMSLAFSLTFVSNIDYWVVKTGPINSQGFYNWAIISGGSPTSSSNGKCIAPFNSGLWMFTRDQVASAELKDEITKEILGLGLDAKAMNPIAQEGCLYEGNDPSLYRDIVVTVSILVLQVENEDVDTRSRIKQSDIRLLVNSTNVAVIEVTI
ncbi:hypothetical protein HDU76_007354 [Blyttiomyces sp. JEL0837]|nr:hypothetical protein HDU76_007354 [Blyttiomyces sp. JEL0837]